MYILNSMPGAVAQGLIWGIMAIGLYITYKILDIADLTVDGSICTGASVYVIMILGGFSTPIAMFVAFIAGMLTGLVTGIFHTVMGIPAILAGILTQLSLYSVNLIILGKPTQTVSPDKYKMLVSLRYLRDVPFYRNSIFVLVIVVAVIIAIMYWFFGTELGCSIRATGSNLNMSRAQGINTKFNTVLGLMISNGIVALSGSLLAQYNGYSDVNNTGRGAIVIGLAAIIIGQALFERIFRNFALTLFSVAIGGVIYYIVYQIVICLGISTDLLKLLSALVVAVFLGVPYLKKTYFGRVKKTGPVKEGAEHA